MGRKRSNYICPKCNQLGRHPRSKRSKYGEYLYVEHYDPVKRKTLKTCYIDNILRENKLKEIRDGPFPEAHVANYELTKALEKLLRSIDVISDLMIKSDITPQDKRKLVLWIREGTKELETIFWTYYLNQKLRSKDNRTIEEENLLKQTEKFLDHINKIFCQTNTMIEFISLVRKNQIKDLDSSESRKIIQENLSGFLNFSDLSINKAFSYWFDKYERPKREDRINALREKYSDGAFGSEKYPGTVGY